MWLKNLFQSLTSTAARRRPARRRPQPARLCFEPLEDRCLLAYSVIDLGSLGGGFSRAEDINAPGQVVGWSIGTNGSGHAFLWQNGVMTDLGTLGGNFNHFSRAFGINDVGQVVGYSTAADGKDHAFLLTPEDTDGNGAPDRWFRDSNSDGKNDLMLDLGPNSVAFDLNNAGQVVGNLETGSYQEHAFLWQDGGMTDLGTLGGTSSSASAINDAGQITGYSDMSTGIRSGFLWQGGVMHAVGGSYAASDVNQSGQVAGAASYSATLWTPTTPNGTAGSFTANLAWAPDFVGYGEYAYAYSIATAVNDFGAIVGHTLTAHSYYDPEGGYNYETSRAFVSTDEFTEELWELQDATAINNAGQIAGNGPYDYTGEAPLRAYLLTPESNPTPLVYIDDVSVIEGNSGTRNAVFTVRLSAASSQAVTVNFTTANGSATVGSDYMATSGTVTFLPGQFFQPISVPVIGDRVNEANESFFVNLTGVMGATIANGQGVGTIVDDEPRISIGDVTIAEGNTATRQASFTVTLAAAYDVSVTVAYATANGTATAGSDYTAGTGTVTFTPGQTTKTISVAVNGDRLPESNETFFVNLSGASGATIADGQGVGTILDDEPRISISDVTKAEGKKGKTTLFTFTVTLSAAYDQPVTMSFRTVNGTATTGNNDYIAKTGTLTFAPGETSKTITIEVKGDSKKEANETFYLDLFGLSSNSLFTKNRGIGTILNDD